jgi:adenylate cyclase
MRTNIRSDYSWSAAAPPRDPVTVRGQFDRIFSALCGDPRHNSIEQRLFNAISLLNAVTNLGGALGLLVLENHRFLLALNLGTGVLFLIFYYYSRFRDVYRSVYWPFVLLIAVFLFVNSIGNAGSTGGAHYYFVPALAIATILAPRPRATALAFAVFATSTVVLLLVEQRHPEWITPYAGPGERLFDVAGNFLFVQLFTSTLVLVLAQALNQERRKSDRLLLNILPESIAEELKANDRVRPQGYDDATVLFTDFVGFTQIAERLTPQGLVEELDACFRRFDAITRRHDLEKIKTIGDAYMVVGGIPAANRTNAVYALLAALEIQRFMAELRQQKVAGGEPYWRLRLGIHSGGLVAGVVGEGKFAYDVWGDTVNTASRLESSGVPDRINISEATHERVRAFFVCEYRGRVPAKNKGEIDMYLVNGIRPELSRDGDGETPNARFAELYAAL